MERVRGEGVAGELVEDGLAEADVNGGGWEEDVVGSGCGGSGDDGAEGGDAGDLGVGGLEAELKGRGGGDDGGVLGRVREEAHEDRGGGRGGGFGGLREGEGGEWRDNGGYYGWLGEVNPLRGILGRILVKDVPEDCTGRPLQRSRPASGRYAGLVAGYGGAS